MIFKENIEKNPTVICDVAELGEHFLEQVSDVFLSKAQSDIFLFGQ